MEREPIPDVIYVVEDAEPGGDWAVADDAEPDASLESAVREARKWESDAAAEALSAQEWLAAHPEEEPDDDLTRPGYRTRVAAYRRVGVVAGPFGPGDGTTGPAGLHASLVAAVRAHSVERHHDVVCRVVEALQHEVAELEEKCAALQRGGAAGG